MLSQLEPSQRIFLSGACVLTEPASEIERSLAHELEGSFLTCRLRGAPE